MRTLIAIVVTSLACFGCENGNGGGDAADVQDAQTAADSTVGDTGTAMDTGMASDTRTPSDTGSPVDAGVTDSGGTGDSGGSAFMMIHNCAAADYVDRTAETAPTVTAGSGDLRWNPPCMTIRAGRSVAFNAPFSIHPLVPGRAPNATGGDMGTMPNPITATSTGTTATFAFPNAGFYPYYCGNHYLQGMIGVIQVVP
jgi:plastocyanin